ncbi:MAG TPA: hypothetical protein VK338_00020 [Candidatus Nitrosocosmicus sp.]|nr:hypothetical protein [Candidatus Nitrosocosmicus sp.]
MSLTICVTTPEGIVLAADSRQSYQNVVGASRIGSDSATKIYPVGNNIGVTVAGPAFLKDPDNPGQTRGIGTFIQEVIEDISKKDTVDSVAEKLKSHLENIYKPSEQLKIIGNELEKQIVQIGGTIVKKEKAPHNEGMLIEYTDKEGKPQKAIGQIMPISLIVAGFDKTPAGKSGLNAFLVHIPGIKEHKRQHGHPNQFGATWTGQTDVISRVVLGYDQRMNNLLFIQAARQNMGNDKVNEQLQSLEYIINWGAMTLPDAVDFAKLMIQTTSAIQRFSDGIPMLPGDIPGVGGPVDVAIILPEKGFHWHQTKELKLEKPEMS